MNLAGHALQWYVPGLMRRRALEELFGATADAFGVPYPLAGDTTVDELLERYARFTAAQASAALGSGSDLWPVRHRLFDSAYGIGARLRHQLGIESSGDAMAAARAVYRMLHIDFRGTADGEIRIADCYFSRFYSPAVCRLISSLDQGLLAGLTDGDRLEFRQRITEGASCCAATLAGVSR